MIMSGTPTLQRFTPAQQKLLDTLANGREYKTVIDLCSAAGVSRETYYRSLESDTFRKKIIAITRQQMMADVPQVMRSVIKQAKRGSFPHAKLYLDTVGVTEPDQTNVNIGIQVLSNVPQPQIQVSTVVQGTESAAETIVEPSTLVDETPPTTD
jgi:hypothetical protein